MYDLFITTKYLVTDTRLILTINKYCSDIKQNKIFAENLYVEFVEL